MTSPAPSSPQAAQATEHHRTGMPLLGVLIFVVAAAGLTFHVLLYLVAPSEWIDAFVDGFGLRISAGVAIVTLLANRLHYWRTRMRLDVASQILAYLWILTTVLYVLYFPTGLQGHSGG